MASDDLGCASSRRFDHVLPLILGVCHLVDRPVALVARSPRLDAVPLLLLLQRASNLLRGALKARYLLHLLSHSLGDRTVRLREHGLPGHLAGSLDLARLLREELLHAPLLLLLARRGRLGVLLPPGQTLWLLDHPPEALRQGLQLAVWRSKSRLG